MTDREAAFKPGADRTLRYGGGEAAHPLVEPSGRSLRGTPADGLLVLALLALSGNPALGLIFGWEPLLILMCLVLALAAIVRGRYLWVRGSAAPFVVFSLLFLLQAIYFQFVPWMTIGGFFARMFVGYMCVRWVMDFPLAYLRAIHWLCLLSLVIWGLGKTGLISSLIFSSIFISEQQWVDLQSFTAVVHTFRITHGGEVLRNCGMFWEPGAFAAYIIVGVIFLNAKRDDLDRADYRKRLGVLLVTLVTTQSTAGYMALPLAMLVALRQPETTSRGKLGGLIKQLVLILLGAVVAFGIYSKSDFLSDKFESQLATLTQTSQLDYGERNTRFSSMMFDVQYFVESPVFGNGPHERTRYRYHLESGNIGGHGNGLSDFLARYGVAGVLAYCYFFLRGMRLHVPNPLVAMTALLAVLFIAYGEPLFNYPLYLGLMFLACSPRGRALTDDEP